MICPAESKKPIKSFGSQYLFKIGYFTCSKASIVMRYISNAFLLSIHALFFLCLSVCPSVLCPHCGCFMKSCSISLHDRTACQPVEMQTLLDFPLQEKTTQVVLQKNPQIPVQCLSAHKFSVFWAFLYFYKVQDHGTKSSSCRRVC